MNTFVNARPSHGRQMLGVLLVVTALLAASLMVRFSAAHAADYRGGQLNPGQWLYSGDSLWSPAGTYRLIMQGDGNLVLYASGNKVIWATNTFKAGTAAVIQGDGNFVLYAPGNVPIWATGTSNHPGTVLQLQDDSNLVLYAPGHVAIWATNSGSNPKVEAAIKWFTDRLGSTVYESNCEKAVENAYGNYGGTSNGGYTSAMANWNDRVAKGQAHYPYTAAPRGALVFWANTDSRGYGHVAISLGDGRIVSTSVSHKIGIAPITYFWNQGPVGWAYEPW